MIAATTQPNRCITLLSTAPIAPALRNTLGGLALLLCAHGADAEILTQPPRDVDVVGRIRTVTARAEDTLLDIARRNDIGQDEILEANPDVDRWLPGAGTKVVIPSRYVLPNAERKGIILNAPEMRLYYFRPGHDGEPPVLETYPVSVGRMDWNTPVGTTRVVKKVRDPSWHPPESIRKEAEAKGESLPEVVPAGPDNPLGRYAMRLGIPGYLIHSTNKPFGVGMRVTHGCVRMYPEDIEKLFPEVPTGTPVQIVNQPVKLGWLFDTLYIEVHPPLEEDDKGYEGLLQLAMDQLNRMWEKRPFRLDVPALKQAVRARSGMPVAIGQALESR
ncbi:MAG TPA: LysM peptidoglycan-binding domain-containing protein [Gammaproteobacteria bacterium]|nr:LysM peptidoglycan-binding domain-containing protein [Gammaproteobacteria bacterium]